MEIISNQSVTKFGDGIINLSGKKIGLKDFGALKYKKLIWKFKIIPCLKPHKDFCISTTLFFLFWT